MTGEDRREALDTLTKDIESLDESQQQFILGYIAGVSASQGEKKTA